MYAIHIILALIAFLLCLQEILNSSFNYSAYHLSSQTQRGRAQDTADDIVEFTFPFLIVASHMLTNLLTYLVAARLEGNWVVKESTEHRSRVPFWLFCCSLLFFLRLAYTSITKVASWHFRCQTAQKALDFLVHFSDNYCFHSYA